MPDIQPQYLIGTVSKRSGVKPDLVRAWERRYQAVKPVRSEGRQRLYSDNDILKLKLLNQATQQGHSISKIAALSVTQLQNLLGEEINPSPPLIFANQQQLAEEYLQKCMLAIEQFDAHNLEKYFESSLLELGTLTFIELLLTPLLHQIGSHWENGKLRPAQEHIASAIIRSMAYILRSNTPKNPDAPHLIVGTPIGQLHEFGALLASIIAELKGWKVTYLGPNLPAEEFAITAKHQKTRAIALSISLNDENLNIARELRKLRKLVKPDTAIIIGGQQSLLYQALEKELAIHVVNDCINQYKLLLERLS